jgi:hypothetical protein
MPSGIAVATGDDQRDHGELDRRGQAFGDHVDHRAAVEEALAEIALQRIADEDEEALDQRPVEAELGAQPGDLLGLDALVADHDLHRVAGGERDHQEDDHADAEEDRDQLQQPGEKARQRHRRVPSRSGRGGARRGSGRGAARTGAHSR